MSLNIILLENALGEMIGVLKILCMRMAKFSQVRFIKSLDNTCIEEWDASGVDIAAQVFA